MLVNPSGLLAAIAAPARLPRSAVPDPIAARGVAEP
jgi:hypothetical protein